jgi:hypothetical protein
VDYLFANGLASTSVKMETGVGVRMELGWTKNIIRNTWEK